MSRTSVSAVKDIYDVQNDSVTDASIQAHIDAASELVDEIEANGDLPSSRLETIEQYLAAHLLSLQSPRLDSETIGSNELDYEHSSTYLETAKMLDSTDTLDTETEEQANIYVPEGR